MEARIKSQFTPGIFDEALRRYGIDTSSLHALDGFESFVYEFTLDGKDLILRISHSLHRSTEAIAGEIDWIDQNTMFLLPRE